MKHEYPSAGIPVLSFRGHAGKPQEDDGELLEDIAFVVALIAIFAVAAIWLSLWAINKPVHPFACDQKRSECVAASEPF